MNVKVFERTFADLFFVSFSKCKESLEQYDWKKIHRQIYQSKQMKARRYPDIEKYKKDFKNFQNNYPVKKKEFMDNKNTEEKLINWLESQR